MFSATPTARWTRDRGPDCSGPVSQPEPETDQRHPAEGIGGAQQEAAVHPVDVNAGAGVHTSSDALVSTSRSMPAISANSGSPMVSGGASWMTGSRLIGPAVEARFEQGLGEESP